MAGSVNQVSDETIGGKNDRDADRSNQLVRLAHWRIWRGVNASGRPDAAAAGHLRRPVRPLLRRHHPCSFLLEGWLSSILILNIHVSVFWSRECTFEGNRESEREHVILDLRPRVACAGQRALAVLDERLSRNQRFDAVARILGQSKSIFGRIVEDITCGPPVRNGIVQYADRPQDAGWVQADLKYGVLTFSRRGNQLDRRSFRPGLVFIGHQPRSFLLESWLSSILILNIHVTVFWSRECGLEGDRKPEGENVILDLSPCVAGAVQLALAVVDERLSRNQRFKAAPRILNQSKSIVGRIVQDVTSVLPVKNGIVQHADRPQEAGWVQADRNDGALASSRRRG